MIAEADGDTTFNTDCDTPHMLDVSAHKTNQNHQRAGGLASPDSSGAPWP